MVSLQKQPSHPDWISDKDKKKGMDVNYKGRLSSSVKVAFLMFLLLMG